MVTRRTSNDDGTSYAPPGRAGRTVTLGFKTGGMVPAGGKEAPRGGREPLSRNLPVGDKPVGAEAGDMGHL